MSVFDGDTIVAMARMLGDMGLDYYIKDVVVRPEYQGKGIGRMLINELLSLIDDNGIKGTHIFVELCAEPDKIPFYGKFGFDFNESKSMKMMYEVGQQFPNDEELNEIYCLKISHYLII